MHPSHPTPPPALFKWSTLLRWVSPVLLASIALHGLAVLVPVPEREVVIEEPEVEELEPIQVSTLPPGALESKEPEPEIFVAPPPPPEPEPEPDPEPIALPEPILEEPLPPEPEPTPEPDPTPDPTPDPAPTPEPDPIPAAKQNQAYNSVGTTPREAQFVLSAFFDPSGIGTSFNLGFGDLRTVSGSSPLMELTYVAPEDLCFESPPPDQTIDTSFAVVIGDSDDGSGQPVRGILDAQQLQLSGYDAVDMWLENIVFGDPATVAAAAGANVYDAIVAQANQSPGDVGELETLYSFRIRVTLPEKPC